MLDKLAQLMERIEKDNEKPLAETEVDYLQSIKSIDDIGNFDHNDEEITALAYDVAIALGLGKIDALVATGEIPAEHATIIKLDYRDGEYLSGYTLHGNQAKLMESIGLAKYVDGLGYHVKNSVVEKLGVPEFQFRAAWELAQPAIRAKADFERMEKERIARIFAEAKSTGKEKVLESYSDECNDPREECDIDAVTVYAMPDGSRKIVRDHTW